MMRMLVNEIADARPRLSAIGEATAAADFLQLWMDFFVRNRRRAQGSVKAINEASAPGAGGVSEPENRHLAPGEVVERLHSLSAGELKKLRLIEQRRLSAPISARARSTRRPSAKRSSVNGIVRGT